MADDRQDNPLSKLTSKLGRRSFLKGAGLTGFGLAGAAVTGTRLGLLDNLPGAASLGIGSQTVNAAAVTETDILNFFLQLEYLEAEFYTVATTGKTLAESGFDTAGTGTAGSTTGGNKVNFSTNGTTKEVSRRLEPVAMEMTSNEQQHMLLLRSLLGSSATAKPTINLFGMAGFGFSNFQQFLLFARAFEDTVAGAYASLATQISSSSARAGAVLISLVEAQHSGIIRLLVAENGVTTFAVDNNDPVPPPAGTQYFSSSSKGEAFTRNPSDVLGILFANTTSGTTSGAFFPDGVNGFYKSV